MQEIWKDLCLLARFKILNSAKTHCLGNTAPLTFTCRLNMTKRSKTNEMCIHIHIILCKNTVLDVGKLLNLLCKWIVKLKKSKNENAFPQINRLANSLPNRHYIYCAHSIHLDVIIFFFKTQIVFPKNMTAGWQLRFYSYIIIMDLYANVKNYGQHLLSTSFWFMNPHIKWVKLNQ